MAAAAHWAEFTFADTALMDVEENFVVLASAVFVNATKASHLTDPLALGQQMCGTALMQSASEEKSCR